jgi:hypothetical protein
MPVCCWILSGRKNPSYGTLFRLVWERKKASGLNLDGLHGQRVVKLQAPTTARRQVGHAAFETKEGRDRKADVVRVQGVDGRGTDRKARTNQRHAQAIIPILVFQSLDFVVHAEKQRTKFLGPPGETIVRDRKIEAQSILGGQVELPAWIESTDSLGRADAFPEPGIVKIAGQSKTWIEECSRRLRRRFRGLGVATGFTGKQIVIGVTGGQIVITYRIGLPPFFRLLTQDIAHLG